jgi:nucleoside-diphosphate-sugar epimerase
MNRKVLITGVTGFIGKAFFNRLVKGKYEIYVLVRNKNDEFIKKNKKKIKKIILWEQLEDKFFIEQNMEEFSEIKNCVHLAFIGVKQDKNDDGNIIIKNLELIEKLIEFSKKINIEMFINTGSCFEYGGSGERKLNEDDVLKPFNLYGAAKSTAHMFGEIILKENGIKLVTLRPFNVYGIGDYEKKIIPYLIDCIYNEKKIEMTAGEQLRDYIYVDDLIDAFLEILENRKINGNIYNVCTGKGITLKEIVYFILKELDKKDDKINFGALPYRKNEPMQIVGNNLKLVSKTKWKPKVDIELGIKLMINNYIEKVEGL